MKRLLIAFALALLAVVVIAGPVLADGGNASVNCSDIDVTDDGPAVGTTITYHGTVTIVANASSTTNFNPSYSNKGWTTASATSTAWYVITDPDGNVVASNSCTLNDSAEGTVHSGWWFGTYYYSYDDSYADVGQVFDWTIDVPIDLVGDYIATQGGEVTVSWGNWTQTGHWVGHYGCGHWEWDDPVYNGTTLTDEDSNQRTVTSHSVAFALWNRVKTALCIQLPSPEGVIYQKDHLGIFHTSDGWNDPTTQGIVYTDGVWQVEVPNGTLIELDGQWHSFTVIEIDGQGNPTFKYGKTETVATDIGLSQPITITKVG